MCEGESDGGEGHAERGVPVDALGCGVGDHRAYRSEDERRDQDPPERLAEGRRARCPVRLRGVRDHDVAPTAPTSASRGTGRAHTAATAAPSKDAAGEALGVVQQRELLEVTDAGHRQPGCDEHGRRDDRPDPGGTRRRRPQQQARRSLTTARAQPTTTPVGTAAFQLLSCPSDALKLERHWGGLTSTNVASTRRTGRRRRTGTRGRSESPTRRYLARNAFRRRPRSA